MSWTKRVWELVQYDGLTEAEAYAIVAAERDAVEGDVGIEGGATGKPGGAYSADIPRPEAASDLDPQSCPAVSERELELAGQLSAFREADGQNFTNEAA